MRAFTCETLARGARPDAFASRTRGDAKDGRSVAIRVDAIGVADAIFAGFEAARHEVFARVGAWGRRWWGGHRAFGCGTATVGSDILLGAVLREKRRDDTAGRGLELSRLSTWVKLELRQRFADFDARGIVDVEQAGGDFSGIGERHNFAAVDAEMRAPALAARVE